MNTSADDATFLQIQDVVKDFGDYRAVDHVTLDIARGEIFALLGSSGCGKTTLLRMLAGFETPSSGRIVLDGQDLSGMPPYERPLNMMFQSYALFPHLSVRDNIAFGLKREGLPKGQIAERVDAMLRLVQLTKFAARKPHQLSGGQQQRVALARSLAKKPRMLLLDEPLGALDKKLREETQIELVNILHEVGVTCVMVTHDQEEAMTMASRIAVMSEGRFLQVGSPGEIYETPATRFVAGFIGNVNLMDGTVGAPVGDHLPVDGVECRHRVGRAAWQAAPHAAGTPVTLALRPEKIGLQRQQPADDFNAVAGTIEELSYFGASTVYRVKLASGRVLAVSMANTARRRGDEFARGDLVWATWSPEDAVMLAN